MFFSVRPPTVPQQQCVSKAFVTTGVVADMGRLLLERYYVVQSPEGKKDLRLDVEVSFNCSV